MTLCTNISLLDSQPCSAYPSCFVTSLSSLRSPTNCVTTVICPSAGQQLGHTPASPWGRGQSSATWWQHGRRPEDLWLPLLRRHPSLPFIPSVESMKQPGISHSLPLSFIMLRSPVHFNFAVFYGFHLKQKKKESQNCFCQCRLPKSAMQTGSPSTD